MSFSPSVEDLRQLVNPQARSQDANLNVTFYSRDIMDISRSETEGRPIYIKQDFVRIRIPGDTLAIVDQPVWNDPRNANSHTVRFRQKWEDYKAGKEQEQAGTPLRALTFLAPPILDDTQVAELKHDGIHTAEQLAELSDGLAAKYLGGQQLKQRAAAYLELAKKNAPNASLLAELKLLRDKTAAMEAQLSDLGQQPKQDNKRR